MTFYRIFSLLVSMFFIGFACGIPAAGANEQTVYKIVAAAHPDEVQGVAVLLSEDRGVFLTAGHLVLDPDKTRLRRGDLILPFTIVLQGNNVDKAIDDWAVLRVAGDVWENARPLIDAMVSYRYPVSVDVKETAILTARGVASFPSAMQWEFQTSNEACGPTSAILVEASQYDKGDSGSPLFMTRDGRSSVIAITSRFRSTVDNMSDAERELVAVFYRVSEGADVDAANSDKEDAELDDVTLRELLKEKVLVKVVPTKCIIDEIVQKFQDALFFDVRSDDFAVKFTMHVNRIKLSGNMPAEELKKINRRTYEFMDMLKQRDFKWLELIRLWKAYFDGLGGTPVGENPQPMLLYEGLSLASARAQIADLGYAFFRRGNNPPEQEHALYKLGSWTSNREALVTKQSSVLQAFLNANQSWDGAARRPFNTMPIAWLDEIPDGDRVTAGKVLALSVSDKFVTQGISPETIAATRDLATSLLITPRHNEWAPGRLRVTTNALDGLRVLLGAVRSDPKSSLKAEADYLYRQIIVAKLVATRMQRAHEQRTEELNKEFKPQPFAETDRERTLRAFTDGPMHAISETVPFDEILKEVPPELESEADRR